MVKNRMIIAILATLLMVMTFSVTAVYADSSKEPDLTNVTGIRFEPASPIVFEEWVDGILYCDEDDEIHRFNYDYRSRILQDGNALILINKDGSESKFIYNLAKGGFVGNGNHKIKRAKVYCNSPDMNYDAVWHVWNRDFSAWATGDHTVNIEYKGLTCETTVAVVENTIDSVEYLQHDPLAENYDGRWSTDAEGNKYFDYHYFYEDNDIIRITRKDGTVKEYKHKEDDWDVDGEEWDYLWFESKDGQRIYLRSYQLDDNQYNHHWTLGSDNYGTFYYGGKEYQTQVTIKLQNTMKASGKTVKVKYTKLKKKTQKIARKKAFKISDAKGTLTFTMAQKDKKAKNKITVSKKGVVTVKKGLKKGKYTIKVSVKAAGNEAYAPKSQTVAVKIIVK